MPVNPGSLQLTLRRRLLELIKHGNLTPNQAEGLEVLATLCRPLYVPVTKDCYPEKLDRTSSFFFGFPWTSEEFPWPDRCEEGCFGDSLHAPLLQLNLDDVSTSIGENVGSGLFQVFLPEDYVAAYGRDGNGINACIRTIPKSCVARKWDMTAFPLESMTALEACQYWDRAGVPESYDDLSSVSKVFVNIGAWSLGRLEDELMTKGFPSDGYSIGPAKAIVDWVPHIPRAQIAISNLSDKTLIEMFADWEPLGEYQEESYLESRAIMTELFGNEFSDLFPRPALFGWPKAFNAQYYAIHHRQMPLIVFDGLHEEIAGDWIEVFKDEAFWCHGYYL